MPRTSGISYLSSPEAVALADTYVANVRALMAQRGWSTKKLSAETSINDSTIRNILCSSVTPSLIGAAAIAAALGTTVDRLLGLPPEADLRDERLFCLHTAVWVEGTTACPNCLTAWRRIQDAKQRLYVENRAANAPPLLSAVTGQPLATDPPA